MTRSIYRYEVDIDDQWHTHDLTGPVVHVDSRRLDVVEFWAVHTEGLPVAERRFRVYGTGQPITEPCRHVGTVITAGGALVWHLMEGRS